jgi:hypothetical protein
MRSAQLQIRVTPIEKAAIEQAARRAGLGMSSYVLRKVLPDRAAQWNDLLRETDRSDGARIALATLSSWLASLGTSEMQDALEASPPAGLNAVTANTIAAMVEHVCAARGVTAPRWTHAIRPLEKPEFGSKLTSLRLHLLTNSPAAFRSRNIFVDTAVGGQV